MGIMKCYLAEGIICKNEHQSDRPDLSCLLEHHLLTCSAGN